jgi:RimJ/RimL family protein N-acetyltransferase
MKPPNSIRLRPVEHGDLRTIYEYQQDPEANAMAVATPRSEESFFSHWKESLQLPGVVARVILADEELVGHISMFRKGDRDTIGYWIERSQWGRGIASAALGLLLEEVPVRPLHAAAARSNGASVRVLEKCGFVLTGYEWAEATERFPACEEAKFLLG